MLEILWEAADAWAEAWGEITRFYGGIIRRIKAAWKALFR